jgi:serine protease Do
MSMNHPHVIRTAAALLLFSVAFGAPSVLAKDQEEDTTVRIYKKVAPTTVFIASAYFRRHSMTSASSSGIGSGVLINDQGEIVTNAHVVDGAAKIMVLLHDGTRLPAEVVGIDGETDIALREVARGASAVRTIR